MTNKYTISVLLPTRGRTKQLHRSIKSLLELADDPTSLQWCLGFDDDDLESFEYFEKNILSDIVDSGGEYLCLGFEPMGYGRLHEYVNSLAKNSTGDWMVFWNDDAVMNGQGWDTVIKSHTGKFCLQAFDTHNKHPYSIFPIVPREWLTLIGHLSKHPLNDAWLSQIAWMLDIVERIDVPVTHDRADLTGNNNDQTFKDRVIYEGNAGDPRDFNHVNHRRERIGEANKIANYLFEKNPDFNIEDWQKIITGKKDPWTKMLASDVNNMMKRIDRL